METPKPHYEIKHGGPELNLSEGQVDELLDSYLEQFKEMMEDGITTKEDIRAYLLHVLQRPQTMVFLSEDEVLGMGSFHYGHGFEPDAHSNNVTAELGTLIVSQKHRGRGMSGEILKQLQGKVLASCPKDKGLILTTVTKNPIIKHQVKKLGYKDVSRGDYDNLGFHSKQEIWEKYGYQAQVNDAYSYENREGVPKAKGGIRNKIKNLLGRLLTDGARARHS